MTIDQIRSESFQDRTARVVVTGLDPRTPTGNLKAGTKMTLQFADDEHLDIATFRSLGVDALLEPSKTTGSIEFSGRTAADEVVCLRPGNVSVIAKVTKYVVDSEGDEGRQVTLQTGPFPVRCLKSSDFSRYCSGLDLADAGIDMGMETDMETDAAMADAAPDMTRPPAWSISFVPPENEDDLQIGIRNSGFGRPDNVVLRFRVRDLNRTDDMMGEGLSDLPVSFSLSDNPPPDVAIEPEVARTDANGVASV
jgi:hypothetical protein